jgi:hypothetical protein
LGFDSNPAVGGTKMHDNLISNPGRGIYWNEGVYNDFDFYNNHIIARTTVTPHTEGLFDFRSDRNDGVVDWRSIKVRDNIFELQGTARALMRNRDSYDAVIEHNQLVNVSDIGSFANLSTGNLRGPSAPLQFRLGADEEWEIDQWAIAKVPGNSCPTR